tara:strand:+ start:325 stop:516 length:192 start_codon:yes stop_codon:yes gene_type:complete
LYKKLVLFDYMNKKEKIKQEITNTANDINEYLMDDSVSMDDYQRDIDLKFKIMWKNISKILDK